MTGVDLLLIFVRLSIIPSFPTFFLSLVTRHSSPVTRHTPAGLTPFTLPASTRYWQVNCLIFKPTLLMQNISVLLVDDHNIVRQGLKALFTAEGDITIIAEPQTGREAVQLAIQHPPEVFVMDLAMPLLNGWEATRQIPQALPTPRI